jgi:hypothetical protein
LRLLGKIEHPTTITLSFSEIHDTNGEIIKQIPIVTREFMLGDARADGDVNIHDVFYIWEYLVGVRDVGEGISKVHPSNAASVKSDGRYDKINFKDAWRLTKELVKLNKDKNKGRGDKDKEEEEEDEDEDDKDKGKDDKDKYTVDEDDKGKEDDNDKGREEEQEEEEEEEEEDKDTESEDDEDVIDSQDLWYLLQDLSSRLSSGKEKKEIIDSRKLWTLLQQQSRLSNRKIKEGGKEGQIDSEGLWNLFQGLSRSSKAKEERKRRMRRK